MHHLSPLTHYPSCCCLRKPQGPKIGEQQPGGNNIRQAILWDEIYNVHICYFFAINPENRIRKSDLYDIDI